MLDSEEGYGVDEAGHCVKMQTVKICEQEGVGTMLTTVKNL